MKFSVSIVIDPMILKVYSVMMSPCKTQLPSFQNRQILITMADFLFQNITTKELYDYSKPSQRKHGEYIKIYSTLFTHFFKS